MFMLVDPKGGKYWRLAYRFARKQKRHWPWGIYPKVTLEAARKARDQGREQLRDEVDLCMVRKVGKITVRLKAEKNFEAVAREWRGNRMNATVVHPQK